MIFEVLTELWNINIDIINTTKKVDQIQIVNVSMQGSQKLKQKSFIWMKNSKNVIKPRTKYCFLKVVRIILYLTSWYIKLKL